ncbi:hypothetical protein FRX31_020462 [Thalictrum thalictroides]|uniref:Uncharacterized protein n=1 Tax=Thalictrum thalictroides TaxID=46969 RepID=A0A7J6W0D8_THATH|nr:hypothetical protein FRX31_020462 [Thalictrum thalictroides]
MLPQDFRHKDHHKTNFQLHQPPSPSTPSPANGMKVGNSAPHLSTPPGPPVFSSPLRSVSSIHHRSSTAAVNK